MASFCPSFNGSTAQIFIKNTESTSVRKQESLGIAAGSHDYWSPGTFGPECETPLLSSDDVLPSFTLDGPAQTVPAKRALRT